MPNIDMTPKQMHALEAQQQAQYHQRLADVLNKQFPGKHLDAAAAKKITQEAGEYGFINEDEVASFAIGKQCFGPEFPNNKPEVKALLTDPNKRAAGKKTEMDEWMKKEGAKDPALLLQLGVPRKDEDAQGGPPGGLPGPQPLSALAECKKAFNPSPTGGPCIPCMIAQMKNEDIADTAAKFLELNAAQRAEMLAAIPEPEKSRLSKAADDLSKQYDGAIQDLSETWKVWKKTPEKTAQLARALPDHKLEELIAFSSGDCREAAKKVLEERRDAWRQAHADELMKAKGDALDMLDKTAKSLERWGPEDQANFKKWFGDPATVTREEMMARVKKNKENLNKVQLENFRPVTDAELNANAKNPNPPPEYGKIDAVVNRKDEGHTIAVGMNCFKKQRTNVESRGDTMIHEMSHFEDVSGTVDCKGGYGVNNCQDLAKNKPDAAAKNADSFAYFCSHAAQLP